VVRPLLAALTMADGVERRWIAILGGTADDASRRDSSGGMP